MSGGLPKGWVEATFPRVALLNPKASLDDHAEVAFVPMPHVPTNFSDKIRFEKRLWGDVKKGFTHFRNDDVIFAKITPCFENGKAAIVPDLPNAHGAGSTEFFVLRPIIVPSAFLFYWVKTSAFSTIAEAQMTGTVGQKRVPRAFVESHPLPLPPLNEQKRIVAKLDAIMPRIDSVKERLEKIPTILQRFRQSVLTAAVTGKLTEKWREEHPDVECAEVGFRKNTNMKNEQRRASKKSLKNEIPLQNVPDEWFLVKLSQMGEMGRGKSIHRPRNAPHLFGGVFPFIQTGDIANSDGLIRNHKQTYNEDGLKQSKLWPKNTICITIAANIADSAILTYPACFPDSVVGIVVNEKICEIRFLEFFIRTVRQNLALFAPATAQKNINLSILTDVLVPLPPLDEQKEIVRQVDKLFALADKVEDRYQKARARVDALAQSVLAKTFRGELVPQDPDDEPAEKLLQRIQEEKTKMEAELKTASRSARETRKNGAKTPRAKPEEKPTGEP